MAWRLGSCFAHYFYTRHFYFSSINSNFKLIQPRCSYLSSTISSANATLISCSSNIALVRTTPPSPLIFAFGSRSFLRRFSSPTDSQPINNNSHEKKVNTKLVNFSLSDSDDDDKSAASVKDVAEKSRLPPLYDPFNKKTAIEDPEDPKDLQAVFHKMRAEGLTNNAIKMFDALSKDGLTHEALQLFSQIKDKGHMPDVVAHTAVLEAYASAGNPKEALKVFLRMLACGVSPNAYTYTVLIKGLTSNSKTLGDAEKYLMEMMDKGMRPNAATYTAVFEALVTEQREEEARELLKQMKGKGFAPDEKTVREALHVKRGEVFRTVINILFDK